MHSGRRATSPVESHHRSRWPSVACCGLVWLSLGASASLVQAAPPPDRLDIGQNHTCALLVDDNVRCWGFNGDGQLGYGNTQTIGDDETPDMAGPVNFGLGRTAKAISAGDFHTCALLNDDKVRCWGFGGNGRLGYGRTNTVGDNAMNTPGAVGPVDLGANHTARAVTAGGAHSCAILDDDTVRCWGFGFDGRLGYSSTSNVGDTAGSTPGTVGPVYLGLNRKAQAITAGSFHTCALLSDGSVRCWGSGSNGQLGYGSTENVGDNETPGSVPPVKLGLNEAGVNHTAKAITAGDFHTCALLDDDTVRCWGYGEDGRLGYGNLKSIGDNETPDTVGPIDLGGHAAKAISAGQDHTCALLNDDTVRCWGYGGDGRLGYGNVKSIGDNETPASVGPVNVGNGRTVVSVSAGGRGSCAGLEDGALRCWGYAANGRLGYCTQNNIGDDETPGGAGPVKLQPGGDGAVCAPPAVEGPPVTASVSSVQKQSVVDSDAVRARGLRSCLASAAVHARLERKRVGRGSAPQRARARRHRSRHLRSARRRCLRIYGRTPGRITGLRVSARSKTHIALTFNAPGSNANQPPPANSYLVKQSRRPIHNGRDFTRAQSLCHGACRFNVAQIGAKVSLTVTDLRPHTTYYYAVSARDNVSAKHGPRSPTVHVKSG